ncbi:histidine kinase dimerization/phosphoacceptor domain -containing protein [Agrobacterium larrymoorei]|uniref:histidine kinase dimerization/phosphoacceptor domain -containing protein n=1 Tax=Agrobacterium larrymoorei TaxID=160699 RepID=UPI001F1AD26D|nr:histidine kinase dimerization/phosphoacceptor domain -containing protein [Agrobacterium larrymoorei]
MLRDENTQIISCDLEPIHRPGSIQPHGVVLVADAQSLEIVGAAGDVASRFEKNWRGEKLDEFLKLDLTHALETARVGQPAVMGRVSSKTGDLNAVCVPSGTYLLVELDDAEEDAVLSIPFLYGLEAAASLFERAGTLADLGAEAAKTFRQLTGYGRVMLYQFLDDDAGVVTGESLDEDSASFMNHHFPATDIPRQARALYVRNKVRVIPNVNYTPQPIQGAADFSGLDLSDSMLRSVSPVHLQYLRNMGVAASASISIVKDGTLWGLIACHHHEPKTIPLSIRLACQALAGGLTRQVKAKEEAEFYRERIRLRSQEDAVISQLGGDKSLGDFFQNSGRELAKLMNADGFAAVQGKDLFTFGRCPDNIDVREIAEFVRRPAAVQPLATASLSRLFPEAKAYADRASGLLAVTMSTEVPTILLWVRAEHLEVVKWAGNPHKDISADPDATLNPRTSFEAWTESVREKAKPWSHAEIDAASRIVRLMLDHRNNRRTRQLNMELTTTLKENESLMKQKDYLLKEVNHRVQNSLQLVSAFLRMQARSASDETVTTQLEEAQKRLNAVALVHRRLYQDDSVEIIDLSRYLEDLVRDMQTSMDQRWVDHMTIDLAPILISTDRAVNVGLLLTELIINAQKYAYDGEPGSLLIKLEQHRSSFRLIVADKGRGKGDENKSGFGSRMLAAIGDRLKAHLDEENNAPGLRVVVTAAI